MAIAFAGSIAGSPLRRTLGAGALAVLLAGYFGAAPSGQGDVTPPTVTVQSPAANATGRVDADCRPAPPSASRFRAAPSSCSCGTPAIS